MACTKEEIEKKRLAALQKRLGKLPFSSNNTATSSVQCPNLQEQSNNKNLKIISAPQKFHPYSRSFSTNHVEPAVPLFNIVSGIVYLISEDRFEVKPSEFCPPLINIFKTFKSKSYDAKSKLWNFSIKEYEEFMSKVILLAPHIVISPLPPFVLKMWIVTSKKYQVTVEALMELSRHVVFLNQPRTTALANMALAVIEDKGEDNSYISSLVSREHYVYGIATKAPRILKILHDPVVDHSSVDLSPVETTLREQLLPFQQDGVRFGIARQGRCLIADDMGLGKTYQALAIASYYRRDWPLLIVTTSSMRETWQNKIHELLPSIPLINIATLTSNKDVKLVFDEQIEIIIVSYKIISLHTDLLKNKKFGFVIVDESHHLKSPKAMCTSALARVCGRGRAVLLSGTPALSRPIELYTQLALLHPRLVSYTEYGKRYCDGKQTNFGWDMTGKSNLAELQVILQRFLIRRTKEEVLTNLEEKTRETVILDQSLLQFTKEEKEGLSQMAQKFQNSKSSEKHVAMIQYFNESAAVKIPAICKYIKQLLKESSSKFLVFAHHRNVVDAICVTLDEQRTNYICIVGSTPTHTRSDLVDKFQHTESCRCAVLSITAANSGLTLTAADLVIFAELHWNPGILTQAESRAHRIGRSGVVCARYLLARGTADDYIWPMLQDKLNVLNGVGLSGDNFEDTKMKHQVPQSNIMQYMSPLPKNRNDYIPSTNIRKVNKSQATNSETDLPVSLTGINNLSLQSQKKSETQSDERTDKDIVTQEDIDEDLFNAFFESDNDDDLLAEIDLESLNCNNIS